MQMQNFHDPIHNLHPKSHLLKTWNEDCCSCTVLVRIFSKYLISYENRFLPWRFCCFPRQEKLLLVLDIEHCSYFPKSINVFSPFTHLLKELSILWYLEKLAQRSFQPLDKIMKDLSSIWRTIKCLKIHRGKLGLANQILSYEVAICNIKMWN